MPLNTAKIEFLQKWATQKAATQKQAFVPAGGGAPPMDPAMMGGMPPMDPAMMGGMPPMDPAMMSPPPAPPQPMADQEMMRTLIQEELQKVLGGGEGALGAPAKKGNKVEELLAGVEQRMLQKLEQRDKMFVAALKQLGVEIPLSAMLGVDEAPQSAGQQQASASEILQPGGGGASDGSALAKIGEFEEAVDCLLKLAEAKQALNSSVLGGKLTPFDPRLPEKRILAGLYV
jgi:hypothetical protein